MSTLRLVVHLGDGKSRRFALGDGGVFGGGADVEFRLRHPAVSRRHARLEPRGEGVLVEDLGSTNGTRVGGRRVDSGEIASPGEELSFGPLRAFVEKIEAEELEAAVELPSPGVESPYPEPPDPTAELGSLQAFVSDLLPRLLGDLRAGRAADELARDLGAALAEALPALRLEISRRAASDSALVFRAGKRPGEGADPDRPALVDLRCDDWHFVAAFARERQALLYRPLGEIALSLIVLAAERASAAAEDLRSNDVREGGARPEGARGDRAAPLPPAPAPAPAPPPLPAPATVDPRLREIYSRAAIVAGGDISVLIRGESGTGKEVLARYLHVASPRADGPWVALNCAALPKDLLEAELFGIEKGVATGVDERPGKFELADGGTLLLDEVADMAPETQAKMLRVLEEGEIFRLGGRRARKVDVRILAATNRRPEDLLAGGSLRSDLYHRIADWEVELPALRRRTGDILNLAAHFLARAARARGVEPAGISRSAARRLEAFDWPGNVRQLEREIHRAALFLEDGELLETRHLGDALRAVEGDPEQRTLRSRLQAAEREILEECLARHDGEVEAICAELDISRSTFYRRLRDLGESAGNESQAGNGSQD